MFACACACLKSQPLHFLVGRVWPLPSFSVFWGLSGLSGFYRPHASVFGSGKNSSSLHYGRRPVATYSPSPDHGKLVRFNRLWAIFDVWQKAYSRSAFCPTILLPGLSLKRLNPKYYKENPVTNLMEASTPRELLRDP